MNYSDSYEKALKKIEEDKKCRPHCCSCVVAGPNNSSPSFVSLCKAEIITK